MIFLKKQKTFKPSVTLSGARVSPAAPGPHQH